jgi:hypothetical protein
VKWAHRKFLEEPDVLSAGKGFFDSAGAFALAPLRMTM